MSIKGKRRSNKKKSSRISFNLEIDLLSYFHATCALLEDFENFDNFDHNLISFLILRDSGYDYVELKI